MSRLRQSRRSERALAGSANNAPGSLATFNSAIVIDSICRVGNISLNWNLETSSLVVDDLALSGVGIMFVSSPEATPPCGCMTAGSGGRRNWALD
jgi:hypothetical protein